MTALAMRDVLAVPGLEARLDAAADWVQSCEEQLRLARDQRNELIVAAVDHGMHHQDVARSARVAKSHVHRQLVRASGGEA